MRVGVVACVLLGLALAGCLGGDDVESEGTGGDEPGFEGPAGTLSGRVLTVDLDPVRSATVTVSDGEQPLASAGTDDDGNYRVENVPVGTHLAQVTATCCHSTVEQIQIVENDVTEQDFQMEPIGDIELRTPWVDGHHDWTGFISCSVVGAQVCANTDENHEFRMSAEVDRGVKSISVGVVWEPAAGFGANQLLLRVLNEPDVIAEQSGSEQFEIYIDDDSIDRDNLKFVNYEENGWVVLFQVNSPDLEPDVVYQQEFTIYWTFHYWEPAPPDYSTIPDV